MTDVYDYVAGKSDWLAAGLPSEGTAAETPTAHDVARQDVATCSVSDTVEAAGRRSREAGSAMCVVVNDRQVVLGALGIRELGESPEDRVESVMQQAPSTLRANVPLQEAVDFMRDNDLSETPITTPEGELLGVLFREDAVAYLSAEHPLH
ncbi:MAG TPA: CBS domain-containing protein [Actinomycetota bacterium]|nr:CBS domain-containing protein [Actinomycetota bacterium]